MTVMVKICGMTDERAVQAAVDAGADALGFVFFDKSPRNLSPEKAVSLAAKVPQHVRRVAVMLHPEARLWDEVNRALRPDVLQTDAGDFLYLTVEHGVEKWPVLREGAVPDHFPATFVYEGPKSGTGETVDWEIAAEIARQGQMILAGGLGIDNVASAIAKVKPYGVDVSSAVESQPGVKDVDKISAFVAAAKAVGRLKET